MLDVLQILYRITTKRGIFSYAFLERHIFTVEWWLIEKFISVLGSGMKGLVAYFVRNNFFLL